MGMVLVLLPVLLDYLLILPQENVKVALKVVYLAQIQLEIV